MTRTIVLFSALFTFLLVSTSTALALSDAEQHIKDHQESARYLYEKGGETPVLISVSNSSFKILRDVDNAVALFHTILGLDGYEMTMTFNNASHDSVLDKLKTSFLSVYITNAKEYNAGHGDDRLLIGYIPDESLGKKEKRVMGGNNLTIVNEVLSMLGIMK